MLLDFQEHCKAILYKANKTVAPLHKIKNVHSRSALITTFQCYVRTYLDYGDAIYDQAFVTQRTFRKKSEFLPYNAASQVPEIPF